MAGRSQTADEVAAQRAAAAQAASYAQIQAEEQARREAITGYSQAAAGMLQGTGQQIQQGYADAAQRQSNYAKGFSIGFQQAVGGNADQANQLLAAQGSPQHVASAGEQGANVLYGVGGYIPASTMEREGAAFGAAASFLPSTQLGYGMQALTQASREFGARRAELAAQRPALEQQYRQQIFENNQARLRSAEEKRQFNATLKANQEQARSQAAIQWASVEATMRAYGIDEAKLAQAKAEFMTNQTGVVYKVVTKTVGKGKNKHTVTEVVPTGQPAPGSDAAANAADAAGDAGTTAKDKADARAAALANRSDAIVDAASALRTASSDWGGRPITNPSPDSYRNPGKYLDANGKGTNDVNRAAREGQLSWSQMVNQAMQMEEVQQLINRYGVSRSRARSKVVAWLRSFGFRPPASAPKGPRQRPDKGKPNRG